MSYLYMLIRDQHSLGAGNGRTKRVYILINRPPPSPLSNVLSHTFSDVVDARSIKKPQRSDGRELPQSVSFNIHLTAMRCRP